jgi:hypothetical protein
MLRRYATVLSASGAAKHSQVLRGNHWQQARVQGLCMGQGKKARAQGPGDNDLAKGIWSWVYGYRFRVQGLGFRVFGPGLYINILIEASGQWLGQWFMVLCLWLQV